MSKKEIINVCDLLNLPAVVKEEAIRIYEEAEKAGILMGRTKQGIIATVIYMACRKLNIPRTLDEISAVTKADKNIIALYYKAFVSKLKIKMPPADPKDYVMRIGNEIGASDEVIMKAIEIAEKAKEKGLTFGKDPNGVAAAALYIASIITGKKVNYDSLLKAGGITAPTLRARFKELIKSLKIEVPKQYL